MKSRKLVSVALVLAHLVACGAFLAAREPGISFLAEREAAYKEPGRFFFTSGDPYVYMAERPLRNWSRWHGGEEMWVKVLMIINLPSLILTSS